MSSVSTLIVMSASGKLRTLTAPSWQVAQTQGLNLLHECYMAFHRPCWSYLNIVPTSGIKPDVSGHPISIRSWSGSWVCLLLHLLNS